MLHFIGSVHFNSHPGTLSTAVMKRFHLLLSDSEISHHKLFLIREIDFQIIVFFNCWSVTDNFLLLFGLNYFRSEVPTGK